MTKAAQLREVR